MIDKLKQAMMSMYTTFKEKPKKQKVILIGSIVFVILVVSFLATFLLKPRLVPLYSNLSPEEAGQIKESLDSKGITSELSNGGQVISVPEGVVDQLKVDLAAEGIPKSGSIDYSYFGENKGFGMTDNEFNVIEKEATQTEIEKLIKSINGIQEASVMITTPDKSIWVADEKASSSASVVLTLKPGYKLDQSQVQSLYYLVSKSVPDLPVENIVISDQYSNTFSLDQAGTNSNMTAYEEQRQIKQDIEKDLQQRVQQMLGAIVGPDKVVSTVTADIDFTKEKSEEKLVEPVDKEKMEGIKISAEKVKETYSGNGAQAGGVDNTGESDIPTYQGSDGNGQGDYEKTEDRINYEVNRIKNEIVKSPYEVKDLGIQVMVEPPKPDDPSSLPQGTLDDIEKMLGNIVRTSISKETSPNLTQQQIDNKIFVSAKPFNGKQQTTAPAKAGFPMWIYIAGGLLVAVILVLAIQLMRRRNTNEELEAGDYLTDETFYNVPEVKMALEAEENTRKEQIEKMAKDKPEEFAKLLRTWLSEE
ncbi:flagellar basal-body MS-ring/collar protein FliF [Fictibacillus enclensis]|uniref:flagellar basal-body MS-ring/collar protein FliF n=1 Tax=Fictibacillus enclensis TaxID=1017270 RepID=UPI0025A255F4|nr:flagellar basal-body MS-ring/collar protein FliF [Fictibacillus enclensis]MDM5198866.1 flagellar basal-body MS-ring/collar protein FliF [Fictibacillus enclensis]